jgi:hypothetical protein
VSLPGPGTVAWGVELLVFAFVAVVLGELVRYGAARFVGAWHHLEPIERGLLDLYLGGAVVYLVAALPLGAFVAGVMAVLPLVAGVGLVAALLARGRDGAASGTARDLAGLARPAPLLVIASALGLFLLELATATPIATGNTYDSSLLTLYTALLVHHGTLPLSFAPYASVGLLYPQGTTAWLGWGQLLFGLPPPRTALLVTPLFLGVAPLGGYVLGRRWFATERAGVAVALLLAWIGPGSRALVGGSNDFVLAFPLTLLLAGEAVMWVRPSPPRIANALGWGLLLGYSAALNPVGAEILFPAIILAGLIARPRFGGAARSWFGRWGSSVVLAIVPVIPSLTVLASGWRSPSFVPGAGGAPPGSPTGLSVAGLIGRLDPYLFRSGDTAIAPIPVLTLEFAILLTAGVGLLLLASRSSPLGRYLETGRVLLAATIASAVGSLLLAAGASTGARPLVDLATLSNADEVSTWLFNAYAVVAAIPLALLLERWAAPPAGGQRSTPAAASFPASVRAAWSRGQLRARARSRPAVVALAVAALVIVPGIALTTTELPPVLTKVYQDFGNVSAADFALLEYAGAHLPAGARVLVAPGSSAEFLPGYASDVVLLYPLVPGWPWINASYTRVVSELTNATLNATGLTALADLDVGYVAVTGANTVLWPPFSPAPLLQDPSAFPLLFEAGDAYLFGFAAPER